LAYIPSLNFAPQGNISSFDNRSATKTYNVGASTSWEIDIFGKLTNAKRGAEMVVEQSNAYRQAVQTMLVATISDSYYTLLMLDCQLEISRRTLLNWQENVRVMRALKKAGQVNEAAVAQSEANCLSVEASVVALERQINQMENSLSTFLADAPHAIVRGRLEDQIFPQQLAVGVPLQM
ncbi:MAG: TolC family protein, partial [Rikenellaceae bacterium]